MPLGSFLGPSAKAASASDHSSETALHGTIHHAWCHCRSRRRPGLISSGWQCRPCQWKQCGGPAGGCQWIARLVELTDSCSAIVVGLPEHPVWIRLLVPPWILSKRQSPFMLSTVLCFNHQNIFMQHPTAGAASANGSQGKSLGAVPLADGDQSGCYCLRTLPMTVELIVCPVQACRPVQLLHWQVSPDLPEFCQCCTA